MITVRVIRTGGMAGIVREWTVRLDREDWQRLLGQAPDPADDGVDRFVYRVCGPREEVVIPESRLDGPWRALVERARRTD